MIANGDKCYDLELNTANVFDWTESKARCDEFGIKLISIADQGPDSIEKMISSRNSSHFSSQNSSQNYTKEIWVYEKFRHV